MTGQSTNEREHHAHKHRYSSLSDAPQITHSPSS